MKAREIEKLILLKGWRFLRQSGGHRIYRHPQIGGIVIIPFHGAKEIPRGTEKSILSKAQINKNENI